MCTGVPLGVGALVTLRWFIHQGKSQFLLLTMSDNSSDNLLSGRVPSHVTRWTGLYYTGAFMGAFLVGVSSYKQRCMDKIMALDNSILKDQLKKELSKL